MNLMILDGNSILNRGFYGVRPLNAPDGTPTNAVYGFLAIFNRIYADQSPDAVCVAFDVHEPTFRHRACESYKATRKPMPEELCRQVPVIKDVLQEMGIRSYELPGYEADDLIGTVAKTCENNGWFCTVVTGDKDSLQLVSDKTTVCIIKTAKGDTTTTLYTPDVFAAEYGFPPKGMVDLKALMGDSSDNISGVPGIGEKGAMDLLHLAGSIDAIYQNLDTLEIKEGVRKKLREGESAARQSYWLATIFREAPMTFSPEENLWNQDYQPGLYDLFRRLGFNKMIEKYHLQKIRTADGGRTADPAFAPAVRPEQKNNGTQAEQYTLDENGSQDSVRNEPFSFSDCGEGLATVTVTEENLSDTLAAVQRAERISVSAGNTLDSLEFCDGSTVYSADRLSLLLSYDRLLETVFSPSVPKVATDVKNLMCLLLQEGLSCDGFVFDCALAQYLISGASGDYSLPTLSVTYFGKEAEGTRALYYLYQPMRERLHALGMGQLYESAELPLCRCLAEMEYKGFLVDRQALYEFGESLNGSIENLRVSIINRAGYDFNINSPKQLGEVLFDRLGLPNGKKTKSGWSTSAEILENIAPLHPIVDEILEYRMLTKLKSTYAEGLLKVISGDGRIHTNFQMTVTSTGRLSSTEPNLQNIPVRKQLGGQIRSMFVAPEGSVLVDADYSQIELRVLAHISGDRNMINAFQSGQDFHTVTASNVFHVPVSQVTPEIRSKAKAVNFGIVYGMAAFTLAKDTGVSVHEAKEYMDAYFAEYASVDAYLKNAVEEAKKTGYAGTVYGRRRYIPELKNANHALREFGKRVAMNMPIQGTAADIMKMAMIAVRKELLDSGLRARLVLQVHDELIVECPQEEAEQVKAILKRSMENAVTLNVPLPVEVGTGGSWAEAH